MNKHHTDQILSFNSSLVWTHEFSLMSTSESWRSHEHFYCAFMVPLWSHMKLTSHRQQLGSPLARPLTSDPLALWWQCSWCFFRTEAGNKRGKHPFSFQSHTGNTTVWRSDGKRYYNCLDKWQEHFLEIMSWTLMMIHRNCCEHFLSKEFKKGIQTQSVLLVLTNRVLHTCFMFL